jgi:hypothetical protein
MGEAAPPQRVSPIIFPQSWELPGRPEGGSPAAVDAYRQSEFTLRGDLRALHAGMNLQLKVIAESYPSKYRTHAAAAIQLYWSRVFHYLSDSALLIVRGSYVGVPPLVRAACECLSAAVQVGGEELPEFLAFLAKTLHPHEALRGTDIGRGNYHAGGTLAANARLGSVYRASAELARPNFGATLIEVAPESNLQKLAVTFGDQAFHYGWAQLELGWLLELCALALEHALERRGLLGTADETATECRAFVDGVARTLAAADRCRIEEVEDGMERRFLVSNFRRQPGGAPRKLVL